MPEMSGGERVFVGTGGDGAFRSDDGGQTWRPINHGLTNLDIQTLLALEVEDGRCLFLGTNGGGIFRSDDDGQTWRSANNGLTNLDVQALTVGLGGKKLFAGTFGGGVFRSEDEGQSWQVMNQGLINLAMRTLTIGPDGESLFAGTESGIFHSDNWGQSWQSVNRGLTIVDVRVLTFGPNGSSLFAGVGGSGVFRSDDGGHSWCPVNLGLSDPTVWALMVGPDGESLFAGTGSGGVFRSDDSGQTWRPVNQGLTSLFVRALVASPDGQNLLAGTFGGGVFRSADGGQSWQSANQGLDDPLVQMLVVAPDGQSIFAATWDGGVFRSRDEGKTWQPINQGLTDLSVQALAVAPDGRRLFASISDSSTGEGRGIFHSRDGGQSWQPINEGLTDSNISTLVMMPHADGGMSIFAGTFGDGLFRFDDMRQNWQPVNQGLANLFVRTLVVAPETHYGGSVLAGTLGGIFRSDDGGQTWWQPDNKGLMGLSVRALVVQHSSVSENLFVGTGGSGIFYTDNGGDSWQPANQGLTDLSVRTLAVVGETSGRSRLFAVTEGSQIFYSEDGGRSWQLIGKGLANLDVRALVVARTVSGGESLFVGTGTDGVFRSDNEGRTWWPVNEGLTNLSVRALVVVREARDRDSLFVDTGDGVFRSDSGGQNWEKLSNFSSDSLPTHIFFGESHITASDGKISLTHLGLDRLLWATYQHQIPHAIAIYEDHGTFYASTGAAMILRAETHLPRIWRTPVVYQALVSVTWRGINWAKANAVPLFAGLGSTVLIVLLYVYLRMARPNQLRLATVLWLLPRPRHLLATSAYRSYSDRWAMGDSLEQLILLQAPIGNSFTSAQLEVALRRLGAAFGVEGLLSALSALIQRGLLVQHHIGWRLADPLLAQIQRRELHREELVHLIELTRQKHPLYTNARRFLKQDDFELISIGEGGLFRYEPTSADLARLLPSVVYIQLLPGEELDADRVFAIRDLVKQVDGQASVVFAITDCRPTDQGWAQIGTLRMDGFVVLPIEDTLLNEGLATGHERALLRTEIAKRLGVDYDPYDMRDPVAGTFSFFGRDALAESLLRRIVEGRPAGVFGLRKIGKSSLLQALRDRASFPVAAVNLQTVGHAAPDELYTRILRYWVQWARVRSTIEIDLPAVTPGDSTGSFVAATLALLEQLEECQDAVRLGLFLDEVELITPRPDGGGPDLQRYLTFLRAIRGLIDEDGRLSLVVASLNPSINRINAWNSEQNPSFNLFQETYLSPLTQEDCIQMVRNIGRQVGLVYSDESLEAIAALSGGHPFLARQLCSLLYKQRGRQPGQIEAADVPAAVEHFIYDEQTVTHLDAGIWQDAGNPALWGEDQAQINQALLLELARADSPVPQDGLLDRPDADLRRTALINLERFHFIHQPEPGTYVLRYGLLRTWLRRRKLGLG
jgi:photosystem II stability/assembly factor-like uncharacterized protein